MQQIKENVENQRGLVKIVSTMLVHWANKIKDNVRPGGYRSKGLIPKILLRDGFDLDNKSSKSPLKNLSIPLQEFIRTKFRLAFAIEWDESVNYGGVFKDNAGYGHGEILIGISDKDFDAIKDPHSWYEVLGVLKKYQGIMVHELTHAYDNWASKGKYITSKRSKDGLTAQVSNDKDTYLNSTHEISARFNQAISDLPDPKTVEWRAYMASFKSKIQGWQNIPAQEKKRLLTRLATYFIEHNPSNPLLDISSRAEHLQAKIREQTGDPYLQIIATPNSDKIIVRPTIFDKKSVDQQAVFSGMKAICNMADIYRRTVAISYIPLPVAVQLGFVRNKGRRKDFSHSEQFYRLPKRN